MSTGPLRARRLLLMPHALLPVLRLLRLRLRLRLRLYSGPQARAQLRLLLTLMLRLLLTLMLRMLLTLMLRLLCAQLRLLRVQPRLLLAPKLLALQHELMLPVRPARRQVQRRNFRRLGNPERLPFRWQLVGAVDHGVRARSRHHEAH
ncbi:MAG: hypothetical protein ACK40L_19490 [Hydrogenophaga sp.]